MDLNLPSIESILKDPYTHSWLKDAIIGAIIRDPIDAAQDAELLYRILAKRAKCLADGGEVKP